MVVGSMTVETELLIIGGGPGGYVAAIRAAQLGKEVMLVEQEKRLGGVCLNHGCIPTKALIHASSVYYNIHANEAMGITVQGATMDTQKLASWKEKILAGLGGGVASLFKKYAIEVITGTAVFISPTSVHIQGQSDVTEIHFKDCIIATGSTPIEIPGFPFSHEHIMSSRDALALQTIPKRLVVIGGGYIGTEMATVYGKLGAQVTILEAGERLITALDADVVAVVAKRLAQFGVQVKTHTKAKGFTQAGSEFFVELESGERIATDKVLVVVGRKPNTAALALEKTGVALDSKGFIIVDNQMRTNVPHIYAIGDVIGQPMLAHKASAEGKVAAQVIAGKNSFFDKLVIPSVVYNDPEIMTVGLSEQDITNKDVVVIAKFPYSALGRAHTMNEADGFMKLIADKKTKRILGIHAVGANVSELTGEAALAIEMGCTVDDLASVIHPHPTMAESFVEVAELVNKEAIHIFNTK